MVTINVNLPTMAGTDHLGDNNRRGGITWMAPTVESVHGDHVCSHSLCCQSVPNRSALVYHDHPCCLEHLHHLHITWWLRASHRIKESIFPDKSTTSEPQGLQIPSIYNIHDRLEDLLRVSTRCLHNLDPFLDDRIDDAIHVHFAQDWQDGHVNTERLVSKATAFPNFFTQRSDWVVWVGLGHCFSCHASQVAIESDMCIIDVVGM